MNRKNITAILKDETKISTFAEGFLAAHQILGHTVPYTMEAESNFAKMWTAAQVFAYYAQLDEQARKDARIVANAFGDQKPAFLSELQGLVSVGEKTDDGTQSSNQSVDAKEPKVPASADDTQSTQPVTNTNPVLLQVMQLFNHGAEYLRKYDNKTVSELAGVLLAANSDLGKAPFWNDVGGFVDEGGKPLPKLNTSPSSKSFRTSTELKCQYLRTVVIPECLRIMAEYVRETVCSVEHTDSAVQLQHFLNVFATM